MKTSYFKLLNKNCLMVSLLIILASLSSVVYSKQTSNKILSNFDVIDLVKNRKIVQLETYFSNLIVEYHADTSTELELFTSNESFLNSDPLITSGLEAWLESYPDSQAAKLALGRHYLHLGWLSRGNGWSSDTTDEQINKMWDNFKIAYGYFYEVAEQDNAMILAHYGMISIGMATGNDEIKDGVTNHGLSMHVDSYLFNIKRLYALQPKWGGSIKEIQQAIAEIEPFFNKKPKLKLLKGFEHYALAEEIVRKRKNKNTCTKAASQISKAISLYPDDYLFIKRAEYYRCMKAYNKSLHDYNKALKLNPYNYRAYYGRGQTYYDMDDNKKSIDDLDVAISLDKLNSKILRQRGAAHYYSGKYDNAVTDFNESLIYGEQNSYPHSILGYIYYDQKKEYKKSEDELHKAIEYGDKTPKTLIMLSASQQAQQKCEFITNGKKYLSLCKKSGNCDASKVAWLKDSISHAHSEDACIE